MMKQPLLGKKILELREQRRLTQEELVEKCNINVRTIQRIEAGETNPRAYTVKIILSALGFDYEKVFEKQYNGGRFDKVFRFLPNKLKQVLNVSLIAGIVYFVFGFVETTYYSTYLLDFSFETKWPVTNYWIYILIKTISVISFGFFMRGFVLIGSYYKNNLVGLWLL